MGANPGRVHRARGAGALLLRVTLTGQQFLSSRQSVLDLAVIYLAVVDVAAG